ncbi:hypothetical protein KTR66_24040 [Roseococcus sp. SDR]|uniref:hypothetical protein n=1 Tax=Roseococcus sp. SDR TaxID=2835532 RepID=UPI001BCF4B8E|nr:hypothetical protein [Roseococcus sp. SDR]MBS7793074.1 hypothetical protein [Roseococcus sp. SDR]MBV1848388.1 hypothetical protein [Roseococcus sp. SDR]
MHRQLARFAALLMATTMLGGEAVGQTAACFPPAPPGGTPTQEPSAWRSVVVSRDAHPDVFTQAAPELDFSLGRALGAIIASAGAADSQPARVALLRSMLDTLRQESFTHPETGMAIRVTPRPNEAALNPQDMLRATGRDGFRPVAVFNRFDLRDIQGGDCGEHRIVYAKGDGQDQLDRMTLIFEARIPNGTGRPEACRPIAEFWQRLTDPGMSAAAVASSLAGFFFRGDVDGDGRSDLPDGGAVISARAFSAGIGQVRGNLFVTRGQPARFPWELREWNIAVAQGQPAFLAATVKENPLPALWRAPASGDPSGMAALRTAFQAEMATAITDRLLQPEAESPGLRSLTRLLGTLGAGFPGRFDAFVSVSGDRQEDPLAIVAPALRAAIAARVAANAAAQACGTTAEHVLARAGAMTCAGCHQLSVRQNVASDARWPDVAGIFVHVDEGGRLSPALTDHFLPHRRQALRAYLEETAPSLAGPASPAMTQLFNRRTH